MPVYVCKSILTSLVHIGYLSQLVMYEGLSMICFTCGKIGHKSVVYPEPLQNLPLIPTLDLSESVPSSNHNIDPSSNQPNLFFAPT